MAVSAARLVAEARAAGVELRLVGSQIALKKGEASPELLDRLRAHKAEIADHLAAAERGDQLIRRCWDAGVTIAGCAGGGIIVNDVGNHEALRREIFAHQADVLTALNIDPEEESAEEDELP